MNIYSKLYLKSNLMKTSKDYVRLYFTIAIILLVSFSHHLKLMVFHWKLIDNKSSKVSRALVSILADLNNAVVWIISILPLILRPSSLSSNPFWTVWRVPRIIAITVTMKFHFLSSLSRSKYSLFVFFDFHSVVRRDGKIHYTVGSLFC